MMKSVWIAGLAVMVSAADGAAPGVHPAAPPSVSAQQSGGSERPIAFCRYDIDVRRLPDPHVRLGHLLARYATCPFIAGQFAPARMYTIEIGATECSGEALKGLPIVTATRISRAEQQRDSSECFPLWKPTQIDKPAPGKVYLLQAPRRNFNYRRPSDPLGDIAIRVTELAGLPVSQLEVQGNERVSYACFEMMPGAEIDPLTYLRATSEPLPAGTTETEGVADNCLHALAVKLRRSPD